MSSFGFAALDIETQDWDRFVVGALLRADGTTFVSWDAAELFYEVANYDGVIWTWAGGRYDMVWLAHMAVALGVPCSATMSGGQIVTLKIGKAIIKDGCKLYPVPLAVAVLLVGGRKLSTGLTCRCGAGCGGYCSIRQRGMARADKRRLVEYLLGDLAATAETIAALHALAEELGIELRSTVGASAWATLQAMGAPKAQWKKGSAWRDYRFARSGYYGGRTEVYRTRIDRVYRYDINSAYPAALVSTPVPTGSYRRLGPEAKRFFDARAPGVYAAVVRVPADMHVPPLPVRGEGRLMFPTGRIRGAWYRDELGAALAVGCKIERFISAMVWEREEKIAKPFMETYWGHRSRFGKKTPQGAWLKWFVNSLTGKLAMRPEGERIAIAPESVKSCPATDWCFDGALCIGAQRCCQCTCRDTCGKWRPIDKQRMIWSIPTHQLADCMHVQWAGTLTSIPRIGVGERLREGGEASAYCDTDAVYAGKELHRNIGPELGQWNFEGVGVDWRALAPKAYRYADAETGEYHTRAKGVPDVDAIRFDQWAGFDGEENKIALALDRGVWGLKGGARRGQVFGRRNIERSTRGRIGFVGGRVAHADGSTSPLAWSEYVKLVQEGLL